jgi:hypothetical protein
MPVRLIAATPAAALGTEVVSWPANPRWRRDAGHPILGVPDWHHQANQANLMLKRISAGLKVSRNIARMAIRLVFKYPHC